MLSVKLSNRRILPFNIFFKISKKSISICLFQGPDNQNKIKGKLRLFSSIFRPTSQKILPKRNFKKPSLVKSLKISQRRSGLEEEYFKMEDNVAEEQFNKVEDHQERILSDNTGSMLQKDLPVKEESIKERLLNLLRHSILRPLDSMLGDPLSNTVQPEDIKSQNHQSEEETLSGVQNDIERNEENVPFSKPNPARLQPYQNPFSPNSKPGSYSDISPIQLSRESKSFPDDYSAESSSKAGLIRPSDEKSSDQDFTQPRREDPTQPTKMDSSETSSKSLSTSKPEIERIPPISFIKNSKSAPEDKVPPSSQDKYLSFIAKFESHQKS